jgi:hypothetical protein
MSDRRADRHEYIAQMPPKKFADDGRLKAFGSNGKRRFVVVPCCSEHKPSLTGQQL